MNEATEHLSDKVRQEGEHAAVAAQNRGVEWRAWANQLADLIRTMPIVNPPTVLDECGELHFVELLGIRRVDWCLMLGRLEEVLAYADAVPAAMFRAGKHAVEQSNQLANALAIDEAAESVETCEACETSGQNCALHSGPEWRDASGGDGEPRD